MIGPVRKSMVRKCKNKGETSFTESWSQERHGVLHAVEEVSSTIGRCWIREENGTHEDSKFYSAFVNVIDLHQRRGTQREDS